MESQGDRIVPQKDGNEAAQPVSRKKKVLFVCVGNACRSQMAEALARHFASDVIEPSSAGLSPLGYVTVPTAKVLNENGISCDGQTSKSLREAGVDAADLLVNMSGYEVDKMLDRRDLPVEHWEVGDPYGSDVEIYRSIRDEIERRVLNLAERLRASGEPGPREI